MAGLLQEQVEFWSQNSPVDMLEGCLPLMKGDDIVWPTTESCFPNGNITTMSEWPYAMPGDMLKLMVGYVIGVFLLPVIVNAVLPDVKLRTIGVIHNLVMCAASVYMFLGFWNIVYPNFRDNDYDVDLLICDSATLLRKHADTDYWYWVFYLSKFVEFIDTLFLIVRRKNVIFLHWYHHFITASIVWGAWMYPLTASWMGPLSNAFVHIWMYAYYALAELGLSRKWGQYVTMIQLTQFFGCIVQFILIGLVLPKCGGHAGVFLFLFVQYAIFLVLFIRMNTSRKKRIAKADNNTKKTQ